MENKICTSCKIQKKILDFYIQKGRKNGTSYCRECFNKYCIERWKQKKIDAIIYKGSICIDCNLSYPEKHYSIFDFHHINMNEKDYDWSKLRLQSIDKIKKELDKCILLCSNCHRIRHYNI